MENFVKVLCLARPSGSFVITGGESQLSGVEWLSDTIPVTEEELLLQAKIQDVKAAVQTLLDDAARVYGYDDIKSAVTYAEEPEVPKFQNEGRAFRRWRSAAWDRCYALLAEVLAGERPEPTVPELLAMLPTLPVI